MRVLCSRVMLGLPAEKSTGGDELVRSCVQEVRFSKCHGWCGCEWCVGSRFMLERFSGSSGI